MSTEYFLWLLLFSFFFFNDTATTEIYTLSLHDALPISGRLQHLHDRRRHHLRRIHRRSEEHTSELQSLAYLVCRLLLEKTKHTQHSRSTAPTKAYGSAGTTEMRTL